MAEIDFDTINRIAINRLDDLLHQFIPGGKRAGHEYVAKNPRRNDKTAGSFSISLKDGVWSDFATSEGGSDPISLWQYVFNTETMGDAARILAGHLGVPELAGANDNASKSTARQDWVPILPVPDGAGNPPDERPRKDEETDSWIRDPIVARWPYYDQDGRLLGYAARVRLPDGSKDVVPQTFCRGEDGSQRWKIRSFPKPRPLYNLHRLAQAPTAQAVIFEGEKTADAGQAMLGKQIATTWPGGSNAVAYVDLSPLAGRQVGIWPDNDEAGYKAAINLSDRLAGIAAKVVIITPPDWAPEGWDVADEAPDGWSLKDHIKHNCRSPDEFKQSFLNRWVANENEPEPPHDNSQQEEQSAPAEPTEPEKPLTPFDIFLKPYFSILGYNREDVYIFQHEARQMLSFNRKELTTNALLSLAPLDNWLEYQGNGVKQPRIDKDSAVDDIFRRARRMPVFNPSRIRGRGAWTDENRHVFHFGDSLLCDGKPFEIGRLNTRYIYQAEVPFDVRHNVEPLTDDEGDELLQLAGMFRWSMPASAALLAGWVALAPLCGALRWRPHIWLTGGAGCGKSTILERYVNTLTSWCNVYAQGNSTEAGIRQTLKCDAVPVLFDESEQNNDREQSRVQNILALIRQASSESGAKTLKGTTFGSAMSFHVRSMFCLASIQVGIQQQADRERLTILSMRSKAEKGTPEEEQSSKLWREISDRLYMLNRDTSVSDRLFARMLSLLPVVLQAIDVFVVAAARHFGNQREGDQYGTLLAGAWCMISRDVPTEDEAGEMIRSFDWLEHMDNTNLDDSERVLNAIMETRLKTQYNSEYSVFELIDGYAFHDGTERSTTNPAMCEMQKKDIDYTLQRYGMKIIKGHLLFSNSSETLTRLLAGTPYHADMRGLLSRAKGVFKWKDTVRINSSTSRCLAIRLDQLV